MSTRKDKFNQRDRFFMNLALNLARERTGLTGENPSVGCVIVKNDELVSLGQTRRYCKFWSIICCYERWE